MALTGLNCHWAGCNMSCHSCLFLATVRERSDFLAPLYVIFSYVFVTFPYRVLGHVWYLIVSTPDFCLLLYFAQWQYAVPPMKLKPVTSLSRLKHSTTGYCTFIIVCGDYNESFRLLLWFGVQCLGQIYLTHFNVNSFYIFVRGCPYIGKWFLKVGTLKWRFQRTNMTLGSKVNVFRIGPTARNMDFCIHW